jgi:hypothetical protein
MRVLNNVKGVKQPLIIAAQAAQRPERSGGAAFAAPSRRPSPLEDAHSPPYCLVHSRILLQSAERPAPGPLSFYQALPQVAPESLQLAEPPQPLQLVSLSRFRDTSTVFAIQTNEPPKQKDDKRQDFYANVGDAIRTLREDIPLLFQQDLNCELCSLLDFINMLLSTRINKKGRGTSPTHSSFVLRLLPLLALPCLFLPVHIA